MSNDAPNIFKEYATSTAFSVSLTKRQCHELLCFLEPPNYRRKSLNMGVLNALAAKGLIEWKDIDDDAKRNGPYLTRAGLAMVELLEAAGLTIENTLTAQTLRAVSRLTIAGASK